MHRLALADSNAVSALALLLLLAPVLACGSTATSGAGDGGAGGGGAGSGAGGGGAGQTLSCEAFSFDAFPKIPVTIRFINQTAAPIFVPNPQPGCSYELDFTLADGQGAPLTWSADSCVTSCAEYQVGDCACTYACELPTADRIEPGGTLDRTWNGWIVEDTQMPSSCVDAACKFSGASPMTTDCWIGVTPPGPIAITARAWTTVSGCPQDGCTCLEGADPEICVVSAEVSGAPIEVTGTIAAVTETTLELAFQ